MPEVFVSPFEGVMTAGWYGYANHIGMDIRPDGIKRYTFGNVVRSPLKAKVVETCSTQKHGEKDRGIFKKADYGFRTGNGLMLEILEGYYKGNVILLNHVLPLAKFGDIVEAGEVVGTNDDSGNQSGAHVHLELLYYSDKHKCLMPDNPQKIFDHYKIKVGSAPVFPKKEVKPVASKPVPKPVKIKPKVQYPVVRKGDKNATVGKIQKALLNRGYAKQKVDNVYGDQTEANVAHFQKVHKITGGNKGKVAGPKTQKALGLK